MAELVKKAKMALLGVIIFFGSAFSIMSFHNDVGIVNLFAQVYTQVIGYVPKKMGGLEIGYSIGLALGVMVFFNHFSPHKKKTDPTPLQVEMVKYEQDLENAIQRIQQKMSGQASDAQNQNAKSQSGQNQNNDTPQQSGQKGGGS